MLKSRREHILILCLGILSSFPEFGLGLHAGGGVKPFFFAAIIIYIILANQTDDVAIYTAFIIAAVYMALSIIFNNQIAHFFAIKDSIGIFLAIFAFFLLKKLRTTYTNKQITLFFLIVTCVWLASGALQLALGKDILSALMTQRLGEGRGASGFASEPSFFGLQVSLLLSAIIFFDSRDRVWLYYLIFISANLICQSIAGSIYLLCFYVGSLLLSGKRVPIGLIITPVILLVAMTTYLQQIFPVRYFRILGNLLNDPMALFLDDSVSKRISHLFTPFIISFREHFVPFLGPVVAYDVDSFWLAEDNTVGSFLGNIILRGGGISILAVTYILVTVRHLRLKFCGLTIFLLGLLMPVSSVNPLVYFIIALGLDRVNFERKKSDL